MSTQHLISTGLSIIVIVAQLMLPLGNALAAIPEPTQGFPRPQPPPPSSEAHEVQVIPVDDEMPRRTLSLAPAPPHPRPDEPPEAPSAGVSSSAPLASAQALTVPLGIGNNNYGQTQRDTDNPQNHPGHHFAGPVNLVNGNFFLTGGDFFIPGRGLSLQLARSYNSLAAASGEMGAFGYGWSHSYETNVISETGGLTLTIQEADGALHHYGSPAPCLDGLGMCYEPPPGLYRQLRHVPGGGYELLYKNGTAQAFDQLGRLMAIRDRHGNEISLLYGFCGSVSETLCQVIGSSGERALQFQYMDPGPLIVQVNELLPGATMGRIATYSYEPVLGELSNVLYPDGAVASYGYDGQHRLTGYDDPRQPAGVRQAEEVAYDGSSRVISVTHHSAVDSFFDITYELAPEMGLSQGAVSAVEISDGAGHTSRVEFDTHANPVFEGDWFPERLIWIGKWWWWYPDYWWLLESKVDANYHVTSYRYDAWGNTTEATNALGNVQRFLWEPPYYESLSAVEPTYGNVLSATNSLDVTTLYTYDYDDPTGSLMTEVQAAGQPEQSITIYENDEHGQLVRQTDLEAGLTTEYGYDKFGNSTVITDARGSVTQNAFDPVGRPITTTDQAGNDTTYVYDESDRLLAVTDPTGGTTRYAYSEDGRDNLVQLVNANNVTTTYRYDGLDRLITQTNSLSQTTTYQYDPLNRLIQRTDADGRATRYEYDAKSRMTRVEYYETEGYGPPYQVGTYSYDPAGNLIQMENAHVRLTYEYDELDQRTQIAMWTPTWGATRTLELQREPESGNLKTVLGPGGYSVQYEYDSLNRLQTVINPVGGTTSYVYDPAGRLADTVYPDGTVSHQEYNETNHLTTLTHTLPGETISYTYDYDSRGNMIQEVDEGEVYGYTCDDVGRVVTATSATEGETSYEYDSVGNRLAAHGPVSDTHFSYDAHNRLLQAGDVRFEYNEMGARTQAQIDVSASGSMAASTFGPMGKSGAMQTGGVISYTYDNDMRLAQVGSGGRFYTYLYDPLGNLIGVVDSDGTYRYFLRDGEDIYLELDGNGDVLAQYTVGGEGMISMWRDGNRYLFLYDGRNRVRRVIDLATGAVVIRYGIDLNDPGTSLYYLYNPIRLKGAWWFPEVGIVLFGGGVFWDPWFGVFLIKAWPWLYWPFGPFHPWRPIFHFWPWGWPWPRPWGWPWPRPWPFLWPWPGAWVRPWVIWPFWPWALRPWWPWWYWRWWWGWHWWGRWWCWHPWWWFCKWWWWPWWHPWWWWGYWWWPWWWWRPCWWWPNWWGWWRWWWWPWWWPGRFWWCWWWHWPWWWPWWWGWSWWWWPWRWPPAFGPPELGDAPDPAYPSYRRNLGAVHGVWWYEWLGLGRDGEFDSDQVDADQYDDGVTVDLVAETLTFTPTVSGLHAYGSASPLNVHGWIDWNRDGDWDDAGELVVNWSGYPGDGAWPPGQSSFAVTHPFTVSNVVFAGSNQVDVWLRFRLDYAANLESPRGYTSFGEVEDHVVTVRRYWVYLPLVMRNR